MDKPVKVNVPPAICRMPWVDNTYIIAGSTWIQVPHETTREEIPKYMVFGGWENESATEIRNEVVGSRGNKYIVRRNSEGIWSCTCPGFGFRGKCKHINSQKELLDN